MANDRVSYMYQRDPSVDRSYRPRPKTTRNLFREIEEDEELENIPPNGSSLSIAWSQNSSDTVDTTASVFLRLRPLKKPCKNYEAETNTLKIIPIENASTNNKDLTEKHFAFSKIFQNKATQLDIYNQTVHSSIQNDESLTILTYGTSGSGKTFTMYGTETDAGIVQRAIAHIFTIDQKIICKTPAAKIDRGNFSMISQSNINFESNLTKQFVKDESLTKNIQMIDNICAEHNFQPIEGQWNFVFVWISFAEIYNENVFDLLKMDTNKAKRKNLKIIANDGNSYIKDLTSVHVSSASEAFDVINAGLQQVNYATTNINANSSRSHCILIVNVIHFSYPDRYSTATYKFCDLAGSERLKKTENCGDRLKEAQRINTSLMVLGRCFDLMFHNQQAKTKDVVPFRDSKLTMLLQKSLLGHEKITTIVTLSPNLDFLEENLHVLNFASIAQQIIYKQPKPETRERRAARSSRFSLFMSIGTRNDSDYDVIIQENERLENENLELRSQMEDLEELIQNSNVEYAKREQDLRNKLVKEREEQVNRANEKAKKYQEFLESRSQKTIEKLRKENELLQQKLSQALREIKRLKRQPIETDDEDEVEIEDDDESEDDQGANVSDDTQECAENSATNEELENRIIHGESFEKKRRIN